MPHARTNPGARAGYATAAAALVALQGVGLIAAGVYLIVRALEPDARHRASTEVLGALSVVVGLVIVATATAGAARRRRVRSPLLVLEIICVPIAITTVQGGRWYVGRAAGRRRGRRHRAHGRWPGCSCRRDE